MSQLITALTFLVVVVALPLKWYVTWKLWQTAYQNGGVVRATFWVNLSLSLIITVFAVIFVNNDLPIPILNIEQTKVITRATVLALSIPAAIYWVRLYRRPAP